MVGARVVDVGVVAATANAVGTLIVDVVGPAAVVVVVGAGAPLRLMRSGGGGETGELAFK